MGWKEKYGNYGHSKFVVFSEIEIIGDWSESSESDLNKIGNFLVSVTSNGKLHIVGLDGVLRYFSFKEGTTISINQNILSYNPIYCEKVVIDKK